MLRTLVPRARRSLGRLGLLGRFSLLSLLAIVAIGAALSHLISSQIRQRALSNAVQSAALIARFGIQPQLTAVDMRRGLAPEAVRALDESLRAGYTSSSVETIKLWSPSARVVYSNDHALIGRPARDNAELREALAGRSSARITDAEEEIVAPASATGRLIEVYVPLSFGGDPKPAGAFEIYLHYGPVAATVARDTRRLYAWLFGGLLLLYGALFRIAADASRRLRRQAAENERQARHDTLTGLPNRTAFLESVEAALEAT
ncbi:MAG: GGDEF domain-containing protein, partial [Thermoleophilaceae bacterium]|nr:GGDEF domain-containing protein [Thermoleophilaceae bacterium]